MKEAVTKVIDTLTQEDFHGAFQKLLEWYNKCIAAGGDYFEGDLSFMHVLSKKVPIRKKSGNVSNDPQIVIFWPSTRPKMPFKVMHRKEVTHSDGSYERKLHGRKLADEMGRGKKCPWYTHRLTHQKRVTSELHDSYFRLMVIKHTISKIEWPLNYYIAQSRQKSNELSKDRTELETKCGRESHTRPKGLSGALIKLGSRGERERHNIAGHKFGVKILQFLFGLQLPLQRKPWKTLLYPYK